MAVAGPVADRGPRLVGREQERARIGAFVAALPAGARALTIAGDPGVGKTALWRRAVHECTRAGYGVVVARPAEEDMPLALAGLVDLFEHAGVDACALLGDDDAFARGRAVLAALRDLAAERPAVIAIDDVQWLDLASARALRYALRRLDAEPVGVLATLRAGPSMVDPLAAPPADDPLGTADALPAGRAELLELAPLGVEELRRVLATVVDAISRPALNHIHAVSGGNPLFALELARAPASSGGGLRLPHSLRAAIAQRLDTVPPELGELLAVAAATGRTSVPQLRAIVPGTDELLTVAERHELLVVDDDLGVRFAHPLIGSVVYEGLGPLARRSLHARLAACAGDPDVHAHHLARATDEPCPQVAQLLENAAERARAHGAFDLAAGFAGHCVRLTPQADSQAALRRGLAEIEDVATAGEVGRALRLADALVAVMPAGPARAEALLRRAYLEDDEPNTSVSIVREAVRHAGGDALLRAQALGQLGWTLGVFGGDLRAGVACAREAVALVERAGDDVLAMNLLAELAYLEALGGTARPELMQRALALEATHGKPTFWASRRTLHGEVLLWSGDLPAARAVFETVRHEAAESPFHHPYCMFDLASVALVAGELPAAERFVREGVEAARDADDTWAQRLLLHPLALVAAWRGQPDRARELSARRLADAERKGERLGVVRARGVLGLLALSEGDAAAAARELGAAAAELDAIGFVHPGAFPVLPDAIEAHACGGDLTAATALLERLARAAGEGAGLGPWPHAAAERCRGIVLLARGDADAAATALDAATAAFDGLGFAPDAARARLWHGRALLRGGLRSRASDAFADARERFAAIGAVLWEARAVEELERVAPGRSSGTLTPAERRVADLVAQGLRNREIGRSLYMSVGTVEAHLTRTYRKLGIRCRSELARLVTEGRLG